LSQAFLFTHLEYVPVVRISTAAGKWKLGSVAPTSDSLDILASESAVSRKTCADRPQNARIEAHLSTFEAEAAHLIKTTTIL
jgi:hypothetical protein